jgi:type IV pilus assembly protein PilN
MVRINLLPVKVSKKKEAGKQQLVLFALVLVGAFVGNYAWAHVRSQALDGVKKEVDSKKAQIQQLERIIGEVKNIRSQQDALKEKLKVLDQLKAGRSGPVKMLDELATLTPKRLWLRKMEEKAQTITFEGTAATIDDVSSFMAALKNSTHFSKIELKKTTAVGGKGVAVHLVDFTLLASVAYGGLPVGGGEAAAPGKGAAAGTAAPATPPPSPAAPGKR